MGSLKMKMNSFWSNVCAGTMGAVFSATTMAAMGALWPLGLHLIIPDDAVIPMSGGCPPGWQPYDPAKGQYLVPSSTTGPLPEGAEMLGASGKSLSPHPDTQGPRLRASSIYGGSRLVIPDQSVYVVLTLCKRRERG
jgi:hypothetical protein